MKAYFAIHVCLYCNKYAATTRRTIKNRRTGNQADRFAVAIIMRSIDNNKMIVKSAAYTGTGWLEGDGDLHWVSQGALKIPRRKELVAQARKILRRK